MIFKKDPSRRSDDVFFGVKLTPIVCVVLVFVLSFRGGWRQDLGAIPGELLDRVGSLGWYFFLMLTTLGVALWRRQRQNFGDGLAGAVSFALTATGIGIVAEVATVLFEGGKGGVLADFIGHLLVVGALPIGAYWLLCGRKKPQPQGHISAQGQQALGRRQRPQPAPIGGGGGRP